MISALEPGLVRIGNQDLRSSFVVSPTHLIDAWPPRDLASLVANHLDIVLGMEPELILLGTGARLAFPSAEIFAHVTSRGVGFEVMDNAAACRTYNVLVHEQRAVALAVLQ